MPSPDPRSFPETQWSSVLADPAADRERWRARLGSLFEAYRQPVSCWLRTVTGGREDQDDLCQAFFLRLIERDVLAAFDPRRGRFRHFLKGALRNFVREHWRFQRAGRRAAGHVDLDDSGVADTLADGKECAPDQAFDRAFAAMVVRRALARLEAECGEPAAADFRLFLAYDVHGTLASYDAAAERLGKNRDWVKNHLVAMRARFHATVLAVLDTTAANPDDALASLREILCA